MICTAFIYSPSAEPAACRIGAKIPLVGLRGALLCLLEYRFDF
jgi:hypothetical protein